MNTRSGRPYHHGDLKRAALKAARDIINDSGVDAVSMRRVAKRANATHGAIYQHFANKKTLLSMVAEEGYRILDRRMQRAAKAVQGSALDVIRALARAYIRFAAENPANFRIMSEPDLTHRADAYPPLWEAHNAVLDQLKAAVAQAQDKGDIHGGDTREIALAIWTFSHGYAETMRTGRGFYHSLAEPPATRAAIDRHFLSVLNPVLRGFAS